MEETLNDLLKKEAQELIRVARYERTEVRQGYRSGHYTRNLIITSGEVTLKMPRLKGVPFETASLSGAGSGKVAWNGCSTAYTWSKFSMDKNITCNYNQIKVKENPDVQY